MALRQLQRERLAGCRLQVVHEERQPQPPCCRPVIQNIGHSNRRQAELGGQLLVLVLSNPFFNIICFIDSDRSQVRAQ
jgi:hypothetical protein